ncbi:MAG: O-antigen ligase family protein [Candidatus Acidiferrales bacterium]|jgi:O-antigen ligase
MNLVRNGILLVIAFAVFAFGAVEVWAESIVESVAAILFLVWTLSVFRDDETKITLNPLLYPLLGFVAIGGAQLLLHRSAYPFLTRVNLLLLAAYAILFFLTTQVFRERRDLARLAWFLAALCFAVSLFGIAQHFTSEGTIYWFRKLTVGGAVFGPYVNRNHFAGFVEMTLPFPLALMIFRGMRRDVFPLATLLSIVPIGALILSGSRAGIIGFVFELAVLGLLARSRKTRSGKRSIAVGLVIFAALALIAWLGAGRIIERFSILRPGEVSIARRVSMARGGLNLFFANPVSGSGLGTLVATYPKFETYYDGHLVDHVHNDYIELLAELGIIGGLCGLAFLAILFRDARRSYEAEQGHFSRAIHAAAVAGVAGLLLHSFVDFNLHIPANAILFLVLCAVATSDPLPSESQMPRAPRRRVRIEEEPVEP